MARRKARNSTLRVLFEKRPALYFCNYKENYKLIHVFWIPQNDDFIYSMEQYIFNTRIIIIIIGNKNNKQYLWYGIKNYTFYGQ